MQNGIYDITIIGGGPVGLFAAFTAGMRAMSTKLVDSLPELGGQIATLYPDKYIYDMPGFPRVLGRDLARSMAEQASQYGAAICLEEQAQRLAPRDDGTWELTTDKGVHLSRTVLIAAGAGSFQPRRLEGAGVEAFEGRSISYFVRSLDAYAGRRVLVVGGGDSAVDWSLGLEPIAAQVTLVHRRDVFRAHEESVRRLFASSVDVRTFYELARVEGGERLERAVIYDNRTQEEATLDVDEIVVNIGFVATLGPIKGWGLELRGNSIVVDSEMRTNLPGVFAAGDVVTYPGKIKLIATGAGEAAIAVNHAKHSLDPKSRVYPGHSSDLPAPGVG